MTPQRSERAEPWTLSSNRVPPWYRKALFLTLASIAALVMARQVVVAISDLLVTVLTALFYPSRWSRRSTTSPTVDGDAG